jgi:hypothetical protein
LFWVVCGWGKSMCQLQYLYGSHQWTCGCINQWCLNVSLWASTSKNTQIFTHYHKKRLANVLMVFLSL